MKPIYTAELQVFDNREFKEFAEKNLHTELKLIQEFGGAYFFNPEYAFMNEELCAILSKELNCPVTKLIIFGDDENIGIICNCKKQK